MPPGPWRRITVGEPDPALPDLYLRAGSIIPLADPVQHHDERPVDPLTLLVSLDENGAAQGMLYEDDGDGFAYTRNAGRIAYYAAETRDGEVHVKMVRMDGAWTLPQRALVVRVILDGGVEARAEFRDGLTTRIRLP
jgi:alpha-glucosidase (family GH31 glycosyl hydrolase)